MTKNDLIQDFKAAKQDKKLLLTCVSSGKNQVAGAVRNLEKNQIALDMVCCKLNTLQVKLAMPHMFVAATQYRPVVQAVGVLDRYPHLNANDPCECEDSQRKDTSPMYKNCCASKGVFVHPNDGAPYTKRGCVRAIGRDTHLPFFSATFR